MKTISIMLKAAALAIYALALAGLASLVPSGLAAIVQGIAVAILALHALEVVFFIKYVRLYRGPLAVSVLLTMLFGLLHWKPLANHQAREKTRAQIAEQGRPQTSNAESM
jgi:hypothetical protein